jgi:hypothetical protein
MNEDGRVDRVYRYGCTWAPKNEALAVQLLGQASNYREDLRRIYNDRSRAVRELYGVKDDEHAQVVAYLDDLRLARIRDARRRRGHLLDAGTYWLVEASVLQAAKTSGLDPIRAQRFDLTGRIGAAIQSVDKFPADAWTHKRVSLGPASDRKVAELSIVVGNLAEQRTITWPVKIDRPMPRGAIVKQVAMQRIRVGHRFRWEALITLSFDPAERTSRSRGVVGVDRPEQAVVGIDVGWRSLPGGEQRVAVHRGSDGSGGELRTDAIEAFEYADGVRSIRDRVFDDAKRFVHAEGLAEHALLWRDKERMRRLAERSGHLGPAWWNRVDRHLEDIECGVRTRAVRRRLDGYRVYADRLARTYRYVALEDMPMQDWVGKADGAKKERRRSTAAISLLQSCILQRFGAERVLWVLAVDTSRWCSDCGEVRAEGVGPALEWTCAVCGVVHDQDANAAENLRTLGERLIAEGKAGTARTRRSAKRKPIQRGDGIATGDERAMTVTPRDPVVEAAE